MKKLLTGILLLAVVIGVSACGNKQEETTAPEINAEFIVKAKCAMCHGQNLEGIGTAPKLADVGARLSKDDIANIIKNGGATMPPNLITDQKEIDAVAEYLAAKK